jgi:hypothetical protein
LERYLRVNLLESGPLLMKKEFTGPRSHKVCETLVYTTLTSVSCNGAEVPEVLRSADISQLFLI